MVAQYPLEGEKEKAGENNLGSTAILVAAFIFAIVMLQRRFQIFTEG